MRFIYSTRNFIPIWLAWVVVAFYCRPLLPVDETRLVSQAWDMWANHRTFSLYPPLSAWVISAGWSLWGVSEWLPRMVGPLLSLANLFLTIQLGLALWPSRPRLARFAPWLLLGCPVWGFWSTLALEDMWLVASILLSLTGLIRVSHEGGWRGWVYWFAGACLGMLYAVPEYLVWVIPVFLAAPNWSVYRADRQWWLFYLTALSLLVMASLPFDLWMFFQHKLNPELTSEWSLYLGRWHKLERWPEQSSGHALRYVMWIVLMIMPWVCWPPLWRSIRMVPRLDSGLRICLIAVSVPFVLLSLIPVSAFHHLLPALPLVCLSFARLLASDNAGVSANDVKWPAAVFLLAAAVILLVPRMEALSFIPAWFVMYLSEIPLAAVLTLLAFALILWQWRPARVLDASAGLAMLTVALAVLVHMVFAQVYYESYDLMPMAERIRALEANGHGVAYWQKYRGEYTWLGRLHRPLEEISTPAMLEDWVLAHPKGHIVVVYEMSDRKGLVDPEFWQPYRNHRRVGLWSAAQLAYLLKTLPADELGIH